MQTYEADNGCQWPHLLWGPLPNLSLISCPSYFRPLPSSLLLSVSQSVFTEHLLCQALYEAQGIGQYVPHGAYSSVQTHNAVWRRVWEREQERCEHTAGATSPERDRRKERQRVRALCFRGGMLARGDTSREGSSQWQTEVGKLSRV